MTNSITMTVLLTGQGQIQTAPAIVAGLVGAMVLQANFSRVPVINHLFQRKAL